MHHNPKNTNKIVFVFISIGLLILAVFTSIILVNNKTFEDKTYYRTILDNAKGLRAKPAIFFKGLEIGRIDAFALNPRTNEIEVDFWVFDQYNSKMVKYALLAGHQNTLFGDMSAFELILPSLVKVKKYEVLKEGDTIAHINSELGQAYIRNGLIAKQGDSIESIIASVNTLLLNLQQENNPEAGSLFRILDRVAKITDHLLTVSEELRESNILPEAEKTIKGSQDWLNELPKVMNQFNQILSSTNQVLQQAQNTLDSYSKPGTVFKEVTQGKVPMVLDNVNESIEILQLMLKDVHAQREQLAVTVHSVQQVLERLDKTLQGINNNPLLKDGIEEMPEQSGIEMHE